MKLLTPAREMFKFPKFAKASEALAMAKSIIKDERRWTTNDLAVREIPIYNDYGKVCDSDRDTCSTKAKNAVAFCALGAMKFVNGPAQQNAIAFLREAGKRILLRKTSDYAICGNENIFQVNDSLGHKETMLMFTMAIRAAKKAESTPKPKPRTKRTPIKANTANLAIRLPCKL